MKQFFVIITTLLASLCAYSQPMVTCGFTVSNTKERENPTKFLAGYNAGITFDVGEDTRHFAFRTGATIMSNGWRETGDVDEKQVFRSMSVEMPFAWIHKIKASENLLVELGYGCFIGVGVDGKAKAIYPEYTTTYIINGQPQTINYGKVEMIYGGKLFDMDHGMRFHVGVSTDRYFAGLAYYYGVRITNTFCLNVGYFLKPCGEKLIKDPQE